MSKRRARRRRIHTEIQANVEAWRWPRCEESLRVRDQIPKLDYFIFANDETPPFSIRTASNDATV